jgi:hypothetical protein
VNDRSEAAPGWYANPAGSGQRRWDGEAWAEEYRGEAALEERKAALAEAITRFVSNNYRVESQSETQAVMVRGNRPNHLLHFIIGFVTLGLWWLFVWLPLTIWGGEERRMLSVDTFGEVAEMKPKTG